MLRSDSVRVLAVVLAVLGILALRASPVLAVGTPTVSGPPPGPCDVVQDPRAKEQCLKGLDNANPANIPGRLAQGAADQAELAVTKWVVDGAINTLGQVSGLATTRLSPDLNAAWFTGFYSLLVQVAAVLAPLFLLLCAIQALVRQDPNIVWRGVVNLAMAFLVAALVIPVTALLVQTVDGLSDYIGSAGAQGVHDFGMATSKAFIDGLAGTSSADPAATQTSLFTLFLAGMIAVWGAVFVWIELLMRDAAVYVGVLFFPLLLVASIWPKATGLVRKLTELVVAVILSKLVIVIVITAGALALSSPAAGDGFASVLIGGVVLLLAAFAPYKLLRMMPGMEGALAGAFRAGQGAASRGWRSGRSTYRWAKPMGQGRALQPAGGGALKAGTTAASGGGTALMWLGAHAALAAKQKAAQAGEGTVGVNAGGGAKPGMVNLWVPRGGSAAEHKVPAPPSAPYSPPPPKGGS
jgi:type IV secretion system protein TrbL